MNQEVREIKSKLRNLLRSIPELVEDDRDVFKSDRRKIRLVVRKDEVIVDPIGYFYTSEEEVKEEEFELKDAIKGYIKYGFMTPRLSFAEENEGGRKILYCTMEAAGIETKFRPRWDELLNGINRMVFTEFKNAKKRRNNHMLEILKSLRKITKRAEYRCQKLGYNT
jgi:hypothetical protein